MELRRNDPVVIVLLTLGIFMATSCRDESMPRPRGFLRIDLPERQYRWFDTTWPYAFEYPAYALIQPRDQGGDERYWADIVFPHFNASVHLSYKGVDGNLDGYTEDAHTLAMKHISRATGIYAS